MSEGGTKPLRIRKKITSLPETSDIALKGGKIIEPKHTVRLATCGSFFGITHQITSLTLKFRHSLDALNGKMKYRLSDGVHWEKTKNNITLTLNKKSQFRQNTLD